jgi:hypothetical protein
LPAWQSIDESLQADGEFEGAARSEVAGFEVETAPDGMCE